MENIASVQREYFLKGATKDITFRKQQLRKLEKVLKENEPLLLDAIYKDFKKSAFDTYTNELYLLYHDIQEAIKKTRSWSRVKRAKTNLPNLPAKSYVMPEPLGVSLVIGAWNYPYLLSLAPVVAAIAAGNTVVLKPSEVSLNSSHALEHIVNTNFQPEFFSVVEGGIKETSDLLNQKFDKIFFTGSANVGRIVYQAGAKNLASVTLELGGKSPAFFTETCNLKTSVKRMIWAKYLNAGQTCIAPDYILVHKSIKDDFLKLAVEEIEKNKFSIDNENYVQIINEKNFHRLQSMIDPSKVYVGGQCDIDSRIIEPTIMTDVNFDDLVMKEEIFGPILPVIEYDELNTVVDRVKAGPKPLACYVFTKDKKIRNTILREISFGGGAINDSVMHMTNSNMAFGGVGDSGLGSYHGISGFQAFSHFKSILDKPTFFEPNLKYYEHTKQKFKWIKIMMGQKK